MAEVVDLAAYRAQRDAERRRARPSRVFWYWNPGYGAMPVWPQLQTPRVARR